MKMTTKSVLDVIVESLPSSKVLIQKITYLLVIFSLIFSSLSLPTNTVSAKIEDPQPKQSEKTNTYKAPTFTHPKAITGERPVEKQEDAGSTQPIYFIQNEGQTDSSVSFQVMGDNANLNFVSDGIWLTAVNPEIGDVVTGNTSSTSEEPGISPTPMPGQSGQANNPNQGNNGVNIHATFNDANPSPVIEGFNPIDTKMSFFKGNDPEKWKSNVPVWGGIRYVEIYPGYDLEITSENGKLIQQLVKKEITSLKQFSFSSVISPLFGKTQDLNLSYDGAQPINQIGNETVLSTEIGDITFPIENLSSSIAKSSPLAFSTLSANSEGSSGENQSAGALINFSTFIAGGMGSDIIVDKSTNETYSVGYTYDAGVPNTSGGFQSQTHGGMETVIFKLNNDGSALEFASYLGGSSDDWGLDIDIGSDKSIYITGWTLSSNFPVTSGSYDTSFNSTQTPFISKINPDGTQLVYSTYLGVGQGFNIEVDSQGFAYVTGQTNTTSFPTTVGAYDRTYNGDGDGFVTKINQNGSNLVYSTFIGGSNTDCEAGGNHKECSIDVNAAGEITLAGITRSSNFPTTPNAYHRTFGGVSDAFVLRLNSSGGGLIYSTFVGGPGDDTNISMNVAVDSSGAAFVTGQTNSPNFPTTDNAYQKTLQGGLDSYIFKLLPDGSNLIYSSYLGGDKDDIINDLSLTSSGQPVVVGETYSTNFPITTFAVKDRETCTTTICFDAFIAAFKAGGEWLEYSTLFGGNNWDWGSGIDVSSDDSIFITGMTKSADFPVSINAFRKIKPGDSIYVSSLSALPVIDGYSTISYGSKDCTDACIATYEGASKQIVDPVNSQSGAFNYPITDLSLNSSAGRLSFTRDYASLAANKTMSNLGYGWTHNLDTKLIFPGDVDGLEGKVFVKINSANLYRFNIQADGTYKAARGVLASLSKISSSPDSYDLTTPAQEKLSFRADGKITIWRNATGREISYQYDAVNRLQQISADNGQKFIQVTYNDQNQIMSVNDFTGRSVSYQYNETGDLASTIDITGKTWVFNYDGNHQLISIINPLGQQVVRNEYDEKGRVTRQFDGNDNLAAELSYSTDGMTTVTDALGNVQVIQNNEVNAVGSETLADGGTTGKRYDGNYRPTKIIDPLNHETKLVWSPDGINLTQMVDAAGNSTNLTYDSNNNITQIIDTKGNLTQNFYEDGNLPTLLTRTIDSSGQTRSYSYTGEGRLETETDTAGNITRYSYDEFGQRTGMEIQSIPDVNGVSRTISYQYSYDSLGRLIDTIEAQYVDGGDSITHVTHNDYDLTGHVTRTIRNYDANRGQNEGFELGAGTYDYFNIITSYTYDDAGRQISVTDTLGRTTQYEYDAAGHVVKTTDPLGNASTSTYNEAGQLVSTTDALGHSTSYSYDSTGRQVSVTDALGHTTSTAYNLDGTVSSRTDARGKVTSYVYDSLKRVIAVTDPMGNVSHTSYDVAGNVISTTDASGYVITKEYDPLNRLIKENYPQIGQGGSNVSMEYFYDSNGNVIQTKDRNGNSTTNYYDGFNRLVKVVDALGNPTTYEYDANGNRIAVVDSLNNRSEYVYDSQGRVTISKDPAGYTTSKIYNVMGSVTYSYDANGKATSYTNDELGRVIRENKPGGGVYQYSYDAVGNRLTSTDPNGNTTTYRYDELNRVVEVVDAMGHSSTTQYDENGNVITTTNAKGETTRFEYDDLNRQIRVVDPSGISTSYTYDAKGNRTSVTDGRGISTRFEYDPMSRLVAVIENYQPGVNSDEKTNIRTQYAYDGNGNRLSIVDGKGNTTSFQYDSLNHKVLETDANGNRTEFHFDQIGNIEYVRNPNDQAIEYEYTPRGEVSQIYFPEESVSFTYNGLGQKTKMVDQSGETSWTYNESDLATRIDTPQGSVQYEYDDVGNRTGLVYPDGKTASYHFNSNNQIDSVTADWRGVSTRYSYDELGRIVQSSSPNGIESHYSYDPSGRLTQLFYQSSDKVWADYQYAYDNSGNRVRATEKLALPAFQPFVSVDVKDSTGLPLAGIQVYAFTGDVYSGFSAVTGDDGVARLTLPEGDYRFRADKKGFRYWSSDQNNCTVLGCEKASISVPSFGDVTITVSDSSGTPLQGLPIYAFEGTEYKGVNGISDENGKLTLTLPQGKYRFRADKNNLQFFSGEEGHCEVPTCIEAKISVPQFGTVAVSVANTTQAIEAGIQVYAFDGEKYTGANAVTDETGKANFLLPEGNYRFRADKNSLQFWNSEENNCTVVGCETASISVPVFGDVALTVKDSQGNPEPNTTVYAFNGEDYTGHQGVTTETGEVTMTLPEGNYRFRADKEGHQYFSNTENHCQVPECQSGDIQVPRFGPVQVTVNDTDGTPMTEHPVYVFDGETYTGINGQTDANGLSNLMLPEGSYHFRSDHATRQFWSSPDNQCTVPDCTASSISIPKFGAVAVTVSDVAGNPVPSIPVYAFDNTTYTGFTGQTNETGIVNFNIPEGNYRFRADFDTKQFFSGEQNHCAIPGCNQVAMKVTGQNGPGVTSVHVTDSTGQPLVGQSVNAESRDQSHIEAAITDATGTAMFTMAFGDYRFGIQYENQPFWTDYSTCQKVDCGIVELSVPAYFPVQVTVLDSNNLPVVDRPVTGLSSSGTTIVGANTDTNGQVTLRVPVESYRFGVTLADNQQAWNSETFDCVVPGCAAASIVVQTTAPTEPNPVPTDSSPAPTDAAPVPTETQPVPTDEPPAPTEQASRMGGVVLARYTSLKSYTDPIVSLNSADSTVEITVTDTTGAPQVGLHVYAFNQNTYSGRNGTTDENGKAVISLPAGSFRFRVDKFNRQYWSGDANHCSTPDCTTLAVTVPVFGLVTAAVVDTAGAPAVGLPVYAFNESTYTGFNGTTNETGQAIFNLPEGYYRFRTDKNNRQFWSGESNHCSVPQCTDANLTVPVFGTVAVTVHDTTGQPETGLPVYAFNETTYTGFNGTTDANGQVNFNLPEGSYRFRSDKNGRQYFSGESNHCTITGCESAEVTVPVFGAVIVHVATSGGTVQTDVPVYAFNETTYTGFSAKTDANGDAAFNLPEGNYRFRGDKNNVQYWSSETNNCAVPGCVTAAVTIPVFGTVTVSVKDTAGAGQADLPVYVFKDADYTGFNGKTDAQGQAVLTLPEGTYRLRVDKNNLQYWSGETNHCSVPTCTTADVSLPLFETVVVTVADSTNAPQADIPVYAFDATTYKGFTVKTDTTGLASFTLPAGNYRFRADVHGHQYWSGAENHCTAPGCTTAQIAVPRFGQVTVTTQYRDGEILPDLPVYAFSGETYSGISGTSDKEGKVQLWLPEGNYHFRADQNKLPFWSGPQDHCAVPGCETATISTYATGNNPTRQNVITYTYDGLNRLTAADYESGVYYHYTYDAVGNRLNETRKANSTLPEVVNTYTYDAANRLTKVNETNYSWDANGNLLSDGVNTYTYNSANQLTHQVNATDDFSFTYNGQGDRISKTIVGKDEGGAFSQTINYALDLNSGLTQVLQEGYYTTFLYGAPTAGSGQGERILQETMDGEDYFLADALGNVRQLVSGIAPDAKVNLVLDYTPFGEIVNQTGTGRTEYGFTGELQDGGLVHLRARDYAVADGRFLSRDSWEGDANQPYSYNKWIYAYGNPYRYSDPTGHTPAIVAALIPGLVGGTAGFVGGAILGAAYGKCTYQWALGGKCGCEMQRQAYSMNENDWIGVHALGAGIIGGAAGALAIYGGVPLIIVGGLGVVLTGADIFNTINIIQNETGLTECTVTRLIMDVVILTLSGIGIAKGVSDVVSAWRAGGSFLGIAKSTNPIGQEALNDLYATSIPGRGENVREVPNGDALQWFNKIVDPTTIKPHRNSDLAVQGALEGEIPGGGTIFYRPFTSSDNPAIDISKASNFPMNLKFHFPETK